MQDAIKCLFIFLKYLQYLQLMNKSGFKKPIHEWKKKKNEISIASRNFSNHTLISEQPSTLRQDPPLAKRVQFTEVSDNGQHALVIKYLCGGMFKNHFYSHPSIFPKRLIPLQPILYLSSQALRYNYLFYLIEEIKLFKIKVCTFFRPTDITHLIEYYV